VRVAVVAEKALKESVHAIGSLAASAQITIRPEISAIVQSVHFSEGEAVERGQRLFSLERDEIEQRLRARRAALASARAETEKTRRIFERRQQLLDEQVVTQEAFDEAQADFKIAAASQDRLSAEIAQIEAEIENTTIRSPIDGAAGALKVDPGDFVDVGQPLVTIVGSDGMEIDFAVPERYANQVATGQTVRVRTAANPEAPFTGTVFFVSPAIRQATRDRLLKARIEDPAGRLQPGSFANVELIVKIHDDSLVIPEEALVPTRTGYMVFVVEDRQAHRRDVSIGLRRPGEVEIRQGLAPGDTVIRSGQMAVSDGDRVRIADEAGS
jgi:membrane fusion protein (multidrug efflux system)